MGDILQMSQKELSRLEIVQRVIDKRLKQVDAAKQLKLSYRQTKRLVKAYLQYGAKGLISKKRNHPSHRKYSEDFKFSKD